VHFDNGWNSQEAVMNIQNIIQKCGFDLYTYVIDWNEFRDIQLAYFKAGVIDIEAVTDIAIFDSLDMICNEKNKLYSRWKKYVDRANSAFNMDKQEPQ
jgi:hypothetical protein